MNPFVSLALESSLKLEGSAWRTPCTHCLHAYASLHGLSALKGSMNRTSFGFLFYSFSPSVGVFLDSVRFAHYASRIIPFITDGQYLPAYHSKWLLQN